MSDSRSPSHPAAIPLAVEVEDVPLHLLARRPLLDAAELGDLHAGEGRRAGAQEEGGGLAVEHGVAERRRCNPAPRSQLAHHLVEPLAPERRIRVVEDR
jgi:hypothetical protein